MNPACKKEHSLRLQTRKLRIEREYSDFGPPDCSGSERQRVLLSRALATQSPVLLLDEPTTHLDPPHQVALARLFRHLARTHTVITVLHDLPLAVQADRVLVMRDGAVTRHGESDDVALHAALVEAFDQAIAVIPTTAPSKWPSVSLRLDNCLPLRTTKNRRPS